MDKASFHMKRDLASDPIPVACSLSDAEKRQREALVLSEFRNCVTATEELGEGYAFRFPCDPRWLTLASELIVLERQCCPFLSFQLTLRAGQDEVVLSLTGPEGTKQFVEAVFIERLAL